MKRTILVVGAFIVSACVGIAYANGQQCPPSGVDGWTKIDSDDLSSYPVNGATEYCFKAGNFIVNYIPDGGFGQEGACEEEHIERCGLSHWAYFIPPVTETPEVPTSTPTETPTEEPPTATPTSTPTEVPDPSPTPEESPTPTETPEDPTPTPTSTREPEPTPTELPKTGPLLLPNDISPLEVYTGPVWWEVEGIMWTHNGMGANGMGDELVILQKGDIFTLGPGYATFEVTGVLRVNPDDTWVFNLANEYDLVVGTCSGYVLDSGYGGYWRYRTIVLLQELPQ